MAKEKQKGVDGYLAAEPQNSTVAAAANRFHELIPTYKDCVTPPSEQDPPDTEPKSRAVGTALRALSGWGGGGGRTYRHYRPSGSQQI